MNYKIKILAIIIFFIFFIPLFIYLLSKFQDTSSPKILSPIIGIVSDRLLEKDYIDKIRVDSFKNYDGEYAIYIKHLSTGKEYTFNESKMFKSASLYKLWVMAVTYQNIKDGKINENDLISSNELLLNEALGEEIKDEEKVNLQNKKFELDVETAMGKMITISDNYSAILLASKSGTRNIVNFIKENEFKHSNFKIPPETSAYDIGSFFNKLYKGEIVDSFYSSVMMSLLKKQTLNDRIPKYLPDEVSVAHKTGELPDIKHDAGIIFGEKVDYIIVVLTSSKDPKTSSEIIAKFSKELYSFYND